MKGSGESGWLIKMAVAFRGAGSSEERGAGQRNCLRPKVTIMGHSFIAVYDANSALLAFLSFPPNSAVQSDVFSSDLFTRFFVLFYYLDSVLYLL